MSEKPADWDKEYPVIVTGKTLEAMKYLSRWGLDINQELPLSVIAACDHLFSWQSEVRAGTAEQGVGND